MLDLKTFITEKAAAQKRLGEIEQDETAILVTLSKPKDKEGWMNYGWHMVGAPISRLALRGLMDEVRDEMLESTMGCQCDDPEEEDNDG